MPYNETHLSPERPIRVKTLYETDFNQWLAQQIQVLQAGQINQLDRENLIEELTGLAASDKRSIRSYFRVLLLHLLKWQYQPERRSDSWRVSIRDCRRSVDLILEDSPSLRSFLPEAIPKSYKPALEDAADETQKSLDTFPASCPYPLEQLLDIHYLPK